MGQIGGGGVDRRDGMYLLRSHPPFWSPTVPYICTHTDTHTNNTPPNTHTPHPPHPTQSSILNWRAARALGYRKGKKTGGDAGGEKTLEGRVVTPEVAGEGDGGE
jgi:hypothetical protein